MCCDYNICAIHIIAILYSCENWRLETRVYHSTINECIILSVDLYNFDFIVVVVVVVVDFIIVIAAAVNEVDC